ncbi:serine/threonine-protein phosphatase 1 regulatory subunit 10 [Euwallacea similis]|uniref:serine/threonine-protein phosphatase 1 regulatory subunit 10 n=1 Tax=Euwallacea similis TaxID=1736056 RepID=UPI00344E0298
MPRIDPLQLLTCLCVLLGPEGGILSRDEVPRLVNLMTKFSKKLVSKCVYILILKSTETSLVDMFMAEGGWTLIQTWLQDAAQSGNWVLVKEILELLLVTPVDVERLKMNCLPKVIKNLSRREDLGDVATLSNQIVQNWLRIVKGSTHNSASSSIPGPSQSEGTVIPTSEASSVANGISMGSSESKEDTQETTETAIENNQAINISTFYKLSLKDGKQVIRKLSVNSDSSKKEELKKGEDAKSKELDKDKSKSSSSSSRTKSSKESSKEKDREKDRKKSSYSSSSSSRSKSSSRDKDKRDKDKERDRSKHSSSKSSKSSSSKERNDSKDKKSSSSDSKEKRTELDKDTLDKLKAQSLDKLGRIPKKLNSDDKQKDNKAVEAEKKKPSFSILNRRANGEERSKTVKVFNSKMRSTGLEEEAKPPPPRSSVKKSTSSIQLPTIPPKRPSPPRDISSVPPEKKLKIDKVDIPDRPGAIKLIPPKPKPAVLQESDMFMDALMTASVPKKDAKKRKRRLSVTKEGNSATAETPVTNEVAAVLGSPTSPTIGLKSMAPINFYQDTLTEESEKNVEAACDEKNTTIDSETIDQDLETPASPPTPTDTTNQIETDDIPTTPRMNGGLKGVLLYSKKKGPKRSIKWKAEDDLVEIRYFELDETERVNVTKTFNDMAKMEVSSEREALMSRKLANEDVMEPQMTWRILYICEQTEPLIAPGYKSLEKDIQFAREKTVLPALYYDKRRIPDSAEEPIPENHQISDPVIIPLEDPESQEIDLRQTPWPEPKGNVPQIEPQAPAMFPNMPFNPNFNAMGNVTPGAVPYMGVPNRFPGPHGPIPQVPGNFMPPNMMHNNMMGPSMQMNQPDMMNPVGPMNPAMYGPGTDGFMPHGNMDPNFPMQQPFNGPPGPNMNMYGHNNFNNRGGRGGFPRGGGHNNGGWVQMNLGPRNWNKRGGGAPRGGRLCKNKQNHGYCRNEPNCPFVH